MLKPLKTLLFGRTSTKMGSHLALATPKTKNNFFAQITKPDHKLAKTFYFLKISYVLVEL